MRLESRSGLGKAMRALETRKCGPVAWRCLVRDSRAKKVSTDVQFILEFVELLSSGNRLPECLGHDLRSRLQVRGRRFDKSTFGSRMFSDEEIVLDRYQHASKTPQKSSLT
jgi:hypothetical protein